MLTQKTLSQYDDDIDEPQRGEGSHSTVVPEVIGICTTVQLFTSKMANIITNCVLIPWRNLRKARLRSRLTGALSKGSRKHLARKNWNRAIHLPQIYHDPSHTKTGQNLRA